jgi:hypothetical protein
MLIYNIMHAFGEYLTVHNIIVIILGIIGLIWLIYGIYRNCRINSIRGWPKANAIVLNSLIRPANNSGGMYLDPQYIMPMNNHMHYVPMIVYRYRVNNMDYQSNNVVYSGPKSFNPIDTKLIMGNITPGSIIPVYYNPHNPNESYIYNGIPSYIGIILGIILLLIAGYIGYRHNINGGLSFLTKKWSKKPDITLTTTEGPSYQSRSFYRRDFY